MPCVMSEDKSVTLIPGNNLLTMKNGPMIHYGKRSLNKKIMILSIIKIMALAGIFQYNFPWY